MKETLGVVLVCSVGKVLLKPVTSSCLCWEMQFEYFALPQLSCNGHVPRHDVMDLCVRKCDGVVADACSTSCNNHSSWKLPWRTSIQANKHAGLRISSIDHGTAY